MQFQRNLHKNFLKKETDKSINFFEMRQNLISGSPNSDSGRSSETSLHSRRKNQRRRRSSSKGFKPRYIDELTKKETYNLKPSEIFFDQRIKKFLYKENDMSASELGICREYFRNYVLTNEQRKELWRFKIGNELRITRDMFNGLVTRLQTGDFCKSIDRQIQADLDRTFPDCKTHNEGREMYSNMHLILLLFHIYRPDIGYVQGMNDILSIIFYYYDVYESFVLFSNLIITNKLLFSMFSFNLEKVKNYFFSSKINYFF